MAKQVKLDLVPGGRINTTELELLEFVGAQPGGTVVMARSRIAAQLGKGTATIFRAIGSLEELGLINVCARSLRNGGRLENEYALTGLGRRVLAAVHENEAVA